MAKQKIEIDVPEGYRVAGHAQPDEHRIVVRLEKVRLVTSSDMGSMVEANDDGNDRWQKGLYVGRLSNGKHVVELSGTPVTYDRVRILDVPSAVLDVPSADVPSLPLQAACSELPTVFDDHLDTLKKAVAEVFEEKEPAKPEPHWDGYRLATEADIGSVVEVSDAVDSLVWVMGRALKSIHPEKTCCFCTTREDRPGTECSWKYARIPVEQGEEIEV